MKKLFLALILFLAPALTHAATLNLSPANATVKTGQNFAVSLLVSTLDQAMNAVSGVVSFPADLLSVSSLSKGGSVVGLWVQEPSFSNQAGTVNFEGVALNPGFTGASGRVLTINFRAKKAGTAHLVYLTPAVLANDGQGTNILTSAGEANLEITASAVVTGPEANQLEKLVISSPTHPDERAWYRATTARLIWDLPASARAVRLLVSTSSNSAPNVIYDPAISEKSVSDLTDGVWFFAAQIKNNDGWQAISRFRLQIDTTPPASLSVREEPRRDPHSGEVKLALTSADLLSGIDRYEFKLDNVNLPPWRDDGTGFYTLPTPLEAGPHTIVARVYDRAGNYLDTAPLTVSVEPIPPPGWWRWGNQAVTAFSVGVPLLALIILLMLMLEKSHARYRAWRRKLRQEVSEAEESIGKAFDLLREDLEKQLSLLERAKNKRELTREETRILAHVRKNLRTAEKFIKKEVEDIEREVK